MKSYHEQAQAMEKARKEINETFLNRDLNSTAYQTWLEACTQFRRIFSQFHNNPQLYPDEHHLKEGDSASIQVALNYLTADLVYFSSGYKKEFITRLLKQLALSKKKNFSEKQLKQLNSILLNKVRSGFNREFRNYCRLAKALSSQALVEQLTLLSNSEDPKIGLRASWMLSYLN